MAGLRQLTHHLNRGAYDTQYAQSGLHMGQVVLLNGAQGLGRSGVAGQDDNAATTGKEGLNGFKRVTIDDVERPAAIRRTGIVAQIDVIIFGQ